MIKPNPIEIRPLTPNDGRSYRALRQKIMDSGEGKYFGYSFIRERQFTDSELLDWLTETPKHCIFGTFVHGDLVGIMGIVACKIDLHVVEWDDTWIDPKYRGFGIAKRAYEEVHKWTKAHGYDFAVVIIRENNHRCIEIREHQGFSYVGIKPNDLWADGSRAASKSFFLNLNEEKPFQKHSLNRVEKALEFFNSFSTYGNQKSEEQLHVSGR